MKHKIVVLSDLYWEPHLRSITEGEIGDFQISDLKKERYYCMRKYAAIIRDEGANLVLFAGDLTGDGSCGRGFDNAFKLLLVVLESQQIKSLIIPGNHDVSEVYDELVSFTTYLEFCQDVSDQKYIHDDISILGISYWTSKDKRKLKKLLRNSPDQYDIVVAHSSLKRRTWLFDLASQVIVTGHFDQKMSGIDGRIFISMNNNLLNDFTYSVLHFDKSRVIEVSYVFMLDNQVVRFSETSGSLLENTVNAQFSINGFPVEMEDFDITLSPSREIDYLVFRGVGYKTALEQILALKRNEIELSDEMLSHLTELHIHEDTFVSKTLINDYLT